MDDRYSFGNTSIIAAFLISGVIMISYFVGSSKDYGRKAYDRLADDKERAAIM